MGLIQSVKTRLGGDEEEMEREFERAFKEGSWPEGVEIQPLEEARAQTAAATGVSVPVPALSRLDGIPSPEYSAEFEKLGLTSPGLLELTEPGEGELNRVVRTPRATVAASVPAVPAAPEGAMDNGQSVDGHADASLNLPPFLALRQAAAASSDVADYGDSEYDDFSGGDFEDYPEEDLVRTPLPSGARRAFGSGRSRSSRDVSEENVRVLERSEDNRERRRERQDAWKPDPEANSFAARFREKAIAGNASVQRPRRPERPHDSVERRDDHRGDPARSGMWYARRVDARDTFDSRDYDRGYDDRHYGRDYDREYDDRHYERDYDERDYDDRYYDERRYEGTYDDRSYDERDYDERDYERRYDFDYDRDRVGMRSGSMTSSRFRSSSAPCEVIRPRRYEDVSQIAAALADQNRAVVVVLVGMQGDVCRRVLDFAFGLCCASGAQLSELSHRVYAILPAHTRLSESDLHALREQGILRD